MNSKQYTHTHTESVIIVCVGDGVELNSKYRFRDLCGHNFRYGFGTMCVRVCVCVFGGGSWTQSSRGIFCTIANYNEINTLIPNKLMNYVLDNSVDQPYIDDGIAFD